MYSKIFFAIAAIASVASTLPNSGFHAQHFTHSDDIASTYDYVIIGGGTAGLTVADRLTEDGNFTVLVVEYGYFEPSINSDTYSRIPTPPEMRYNITSVGTKQIQVGVGCCVGGSSAINSMIFMRGTFEDYDRWGELDGSGSGWNWDGLLPYFKKSATFTPPDSELAKEFNITYDIKESWGGNGPIYASWPSFLYPGMKIKVDAWRGVPGVEFPKDGSAGEPGVFWAPTSQDPKNVTRSYARTGHYDPVKDRPNYSILTGHKGAKIEFSSGSGPLTAEAVDIIPRSVDGKKKKVSARKEIIIAGGSIHSPQILQLSGVGPRALLESANISMVHELPGVGQNFHDHSWFTIAYNFTTDAIPNPGMLSNNQSFIGFARELWEANRTGPYAFVGPNAMGLIPLPVFAPDTYESIASDLERLDPASALPLGTHPTIIAGYTAQMKLLAPALRSKSTAFLQFAMHGRSSSYYFNMHPLSRGSVNINISSPDSEPVVDYRVLTNPVDIRVDLAIVKAVRNYFSRGGEIQKLGPVEVIPGANVTSDADLIAWISGALGPTAFHPVGTCAKMPLELGGVVDEDLRVHGIERLSVIDASIIPLIVGGTLQATVYATAEKAADLIKARA